MSPVSLLFSSDEEASRRVLQALRELELEVEPCPDIFTAVEWLTSRSFDLIVADWDSGPEAAFLLKNVRELKLNKSAFTLALVNRTPNLTAEDSPDLAVAKPLSPDQIKYALLSNDRFLRCMRTWIERGDFAQARGETPSAAPIENYKVAERRPSEQPSPMPLAAHPIMPSLAPDFTYFESGAPLHLTFPTLDRRLSRSMNQWNGGQPPSGKLKRYIGSRFFRGIFAGLVFVAVGHIFGQPLRVQSVFANVASVYREALKTKIRTPQPSEGYAGADSDTVAQAISRRAGSGKYPTARALAVPMQTMLLPDQIPPTPVQTLQADAHLDQNRLPATESRVQIPESLKVPQPDDAVVHAASVKRSPSLLSQIEPVSLPEDLSKGLLLQIVPPSYPEQALKAGLQGAVVLQAWIGKDGRIRDLKLMDGSLLLGQAAVRAVKQWRYKPYLRNGVAVEAETYVTVNFNLP